MPNPETFWATIGGVAPVIALASIVSVTDSFSMRGTFVPDPTDPAQRAFWPNQLGRQARTLNRQLYIAAMGNVFIQGGVLLLALMFLATGSEPIQPGWVAAIEPGLCMLLAVTALWTAKLKRIRHEIDGGLAIAREIIDKDKRSPDPWLRRTNPPTEPGGSNQSADPQP